MGLKAWGLFSRSDGQRPPARQHHLSVPFAQTPPEDAGRLGVLWLGDRDTPCACGWDSVAPVYLLLEGELQRLSK